MFRFALILAGSGLVGFVAAFILDLCGLAQIAEQTVYFGAALFLGAFLMLLAIGTGLCIEKSFKQMRDYLSAVSNLERKTNFYKNKLNQQQLIFEFKKAKILYLTQQRRKRLLKKWLGQTLH